MGLPLTLGLLAVLLGAVQCSPMQSLNVLHSLHRRSDSCRKCEEYILPQMESLHSNLAQLSQASFIDALCRDLRPLLACLQAKCDPKEVEAQLAGVNYVCSNSEGAAALVQCIEVDGEGLEEAGKSCVEEGMAVVGLIGSTLDRKERTCIMANQILQCFGERVSQCPSPAVNFYANVPQFILRMADCE